MPQAPRTRRRWFQFGLGTMFLLVTVLCVWLAWAADWARERRDALIVLRESPVVVVDTTSQISGWAEKPWTSMPISLRLLGCERVKLIHLARVQYSDGDRDRIQALFPEATVMMPYQSR